MLDTRFANRPSAAGARRWRALGWLAPKQQQRPSPPAAPSFEQRQASDDHALPAIVIKAQEDIRCRQALARLGYFKVRSAYARHKRERKAIFESLMRESLSPTMDLVRDWLREERSRMVARARWPFLMTMLATILAGLAFMAVSTVLG